MLSIFKRQPSGERAQQEQKDQSLDRVIRSVQKQSDALVDDIRRARERRLLREALGGDPD
jgi:hypothetical protein